MPAEPLLIEPTAESRPLWLLSEADLPGWLAAQPAESAAWVRANGFQAEKHRVLGIPDARGRVAAAVLG
ncbi:MAG TPA: hypothetical protein VIL32_16095, partial [Steroidobacteraceae bacterium]